MSEPPRVWTVSEVSTALRRLIESRVPAMWIGGEVGNLTIHRSGHVYFTIKDGASQLNAVFFDGAAIVKRLGIAQGAQVEVFGNMGIYPARGSYQLNVQTMRPRGKGTLQEQYEARVKKLRAEGLFAEARKKKLPLLPSCIGIVTSPDGAALRDFLQVLERRTAGLHVRLAPTAVQGEGAADAIVQALADLVHHGDCDVIVITRGGGSTEDLWEFNNERLARTIARCPVPVISAVGHEVDHTVADFVADVRAPTPSAAAELVSPEHAELAATVGAARDRLVRAMVWAVQVRRGRLDSLANHFVMRRPQALVELYCQRLDELSLRLAQGARQSMRIKRHQLEQLSAMLQARVRSLATGREREKIVAYEQRLAMALQRAPERATERLSSLVQQLELLSPQRVLDRGYSILQTPEGQAVRAADEVAVGDRLRARLADGALTVEVQPATD